MCFNARFWGAVVPSAAFRLLAGSDVLSTYRFGRLREQHPRSVKRIETALISSLRMRLLGYGLFLSKENRHG